MPVTGSVLLWHRLWYTWSSCKMINTGAQPYEVPVVTRIKKVVIRNSIHFRTGPSPDNRRLSMNLQTAPSPSSWCTIATESDESNKILLISERISLLWNYLLGLQPKTLRVKHYHTLRCSVFRCYNVTSEAHEHDSGDPNSRKQTERRKKRERTRSTNTGGMVMIEGHSASSIRPTHMSIKR